MGAPCPVLGWKWALSLLLWSPKALGKGSWDSPVLAKEGRQPDRECVTVPGANARPHGQACTSTNSSFYTLTSSLKTSEAMQQCSFLHNQSLALLRKEIAEWFWQIK